MALGDRLFHVARTVGTEKSGDRIEGERDVEPVDGPPFDCLFLQASPGKEAGGDSPRGRRSVTRPVILYEPFDQLGEPLTVKAEEELLVEAPELWEGQKRWQVEGPPLPLAKPGELIGFEAFLKRVDD